MTTLALVPLKALAAAKLRLRGALSPAGRAALAAWLARRVVAALRDSGAVERVAVVSPDPPALALFAGEAGVIPVRADGGSLNADLEQGRRWARERGADTLLVALGDLPLLTPEVVRRMILEGASGQRAALLAPDRRGAGTNVLLLRPPDALPFAFGEGSLARHADLARRAGIEPRFFTSEETRFDVDTPADARELTERGLWAPPDVADLGKDLAEGAGAGGERHGHG